mgnify:CR=1 FL=1
MKHKPVAVRRGRGVLAVAVSAAIVGGCAFGVFWKGGAAPGEDATEAFEPQQAGEKPDSLTALLESFLD